MRKLVQISMSAFLKLLRNNNLRMNSKMIILQYIFNGPRGLKSIDLYSKVIELWISENFIQNPKQQECNFQ